MRTRFAVSFAVACLSVALAGCGGPLEGDDSSGTLDGADATPQALTHQLTPNHRCAALGRLDLN